MLKLLLFALTVTAWLGLTGRPGPATLAVAVLTAWWLWRQGPTDRASAGMWARRAIAAVEVAGLFAWELVLANLQQARLLLRANLQLEPRWLHWRATLASPSARALLSLLISLTPGTVVVELHGEYLEIHVLHVADSDTTEIERVCRRLESSIQRLFA